MSKYDLKKIRKKIKEKQGGRSRDPNEFKTPQPKSDSEPIKIRFFILPPLKKGDTCADGVASQDMDLFYVANGSHWVNNRPYPCPRVHDDENCTMCDFAFELMSETQDKDERRAIARQYLPQTKYAVNVLFLNSETNPEDVRGKVMWYNVSKQVFDKFEACICRDNAGDDADPQAYGVFFDEENAYAFQLEILKSGQYPSYKTSKFLAGSGTMPIAAKKVDGKVVPDSNKIKKILDQRHDLFTKFETRDQDKISELVTMVTSESPGSGFDEDDTNESDSSSSSDDEVNASELGISEEISGEEPVSETADESKAEEKAEDKPKETAEVSSNDEEEEEIAALLNDLNDD